MEKLKRLIEDLIDSREHSSAILGTILWYALLPLEERIGDYRKHEMGIYCFEYSIVTVGFDEYMIISNGWTCAENQRRRLKERKK